MKTKLVEGLSERDLAPLAQALRAGQLVAFPTETVYGLGANALLEEAVAAVFRVKNRPIDNPLIVHLARSSDVERYCMEVPDLAYELLERYSPGPLTLVLKRAKILPGIVSAGLGTVAIRFPAHPSAKALIDLAEVPIVAPSANRSGRPSPTTAADVLEDLNGEIPFILDGGPPQYGLESTVLDLTGTDAQILRPGAVTAEMLRKDMGLDLRLAVGRVTQPKAPGMKYRHYAPSAKVEILPLGEERDRRLQDFLEAPVDDWAFLLPQSYEEKLRASRSKGMYFYRDVAEASRMLYSFFRAMDREGYRHLVVAEEPTEDLGVAYMNRLRKAAMPPEEL